MLNGTLALQHAQRSIESSDISSIEWVGYEAAVSFELSVRPFPLFLESSDG